MKSSCSKTLHSGNMDTSADGSPQQLLESAIREGRRAPRSKGNNTTTVSSTSTSTAGRRRKIKNSHLEINLHKQKQWVLMNHETPISHQLMETMHILRPKSLKKLGKICFKYICQGLANSYQLMGFILALLFYFPK